MKNAHNSKGLSAVALAKEGLPEVATSLQAGVYPSKPSGRSGEIATFLTLASLFTIVFGLILGVQNASNVKKLNSSAQQSCTYDTTAQVKKEVPDGRGGSTISALTSSDNGSDMYVKNDKEQIGNLDPITGLFTTHFDPYPFITYQDGDHARVTLNNLDTTKWRVKKIFCNGPEGKGCPFTGERSSNNSFIENFLVTCGVQETYGWIVESTTPVPTTTPAPTSVTIPTPTTQAQCRYYTTASVRVGSTTGQLLKKSDVVKPIWGVSNNKNSQTEPRLIDRFGSNPNDQGQKDFNFDNYIFKPIDPRGEYLKGESAYVRLLGLDGSNLVITDRYCLQRNGSLIGCPSNPKSSPDKNVIDGFTVDCGVDLEYGWVVEHGQTSTPTPTPQIISCDQTVNFNGRQGTHTLQANVGSTTGNVILNYNAFGVPDRFRVEFDSREVINTGFRGEASLNAELVALGYPRCETDPYAAGPICGSGRGTASFNKNSATTTATIDVDAPLWGTAWELQLSCPSSTIITPTPTPEGNTDPVVSKCVSYQNNGAPYKVLYVSDLENTQDELLGFIDQSILSVEGTNLGSYKTKINYAYYNDMDLDFDCYEYDAGDISGGKGIGCRNVSLAQQLRDVCGAQSVYIVGRKSIDGRSSANMQDHIVNGTLNHPYATAHELGHAIGQLFDEYSYGGIASGNPIGAPNCTEDSTCSVWARKYGNEITCDSSCSYDNWHRPTLTSIMHDNVDKTFNSPSLESMRTKIDNGSSQHFSSFYTSSDSYHNSFVVNLKQDSAKKLALKNISIKQVYPQNIQSKPSSEFYKIELLDGHGKTLYSTYTEQSYVLTDVVPQLATVLKKDIYISLPYFETAATMKITDTNNVSKLDINLSKYNLGEAVKKNRQQLCGNNACDVRIGEKTSSCPQDCQKVETPLDKKLKIQNADIDKNMTVNAIDYALYIKQYGVKEILGGVKGDINNDAAVNAIDGSIIIVNLSKKIQ